MTSEAPEIPVFVFVVVFFLGGGGEGEKQSLIVPYISFQ